MSPLRINVILLGLFWTALLTASLAWNIYEQRQGVVANSYIQATVAIEKDISFRSWATSHGGVYVKPTEKSPPNPYLKVPDRDVVTTKGMKLTLINPAYMMRQLYQRASPKDDIKGHITSLKLLNPGNAPDEWEREALLAFERGEKERTAVVTAADGQDQFRYMRPFYVEPGCLKCHGNMGYKVGDIRGGISTMVNMRPLEKASANVIKGLGITHGLVWLVGLIGIGVSARRVELRTIEREHDLGEIRRNEQRALAMLKLDGMAGELDEKSLMQEGLEIAERLTSSQIACLHFINDDQQTIELKAWSKHTLENCTALFDDTEAGLWADCVRTRQPVMHNDYQAPVNKHGYPEGHAHLVRHLSVPVLEGDKVRLILGVGNKSGDYDQADMRLLQMIANDLWNMVRRQRSEKAVKEKAVELESANKELEAFSYSISHDLRSPLRAIDGFSRILVEDYTSKLDDEGRRLLDVVRENAIQMGRLIDDILKFSRTGRAALTFAEVDMEKLAHTVIDELALSVDISKSRIEIEHLPQAKGDPALLHQVLVNLLSNAIKYSSKNQAPMIKVGSSVEGDETVYYVKDNGAGFDMQYVDKLFGVFQRLHTVNEFEGTGIGLAIVKRIIARHGGRVWAEGRLNEGATIYFTLPAKRPDHD